MPPGSPDLSSSVDIAKPDWEAYCGKVADLIISEQTPKRLLEVRGKIYELLSHCIPPTIVLKTITEALLLKVDNELRPQIIHWAAHYVSPYSCSPCQVADTQFLQELRLQQGSKKIYHIEAYFAKIMSLYKNYTIMGLADMDF